MSFSPVRELPLGNSDISFYNDSGYDSQACLDQDGDTIMIDVCDLKDNREWANEQCAPIKIETQLPSSDDICLEKPDKPKSPSSDSAEYEEFVTKLGCRRWPLGICTMPKLSSRNNIAKTPSPRPSLKSIYSNDSNLKLSSGSLRTPDRYLSSPDIHETSANKFRVNKDPAKLTPQERLVRNDSVSHDAFNARRNFSLPMPSGIGHRRTPSTARPGGMFKAHFISGARAYSSHRSKRNHLSSRSKCQ